MKDRSFIYAMNEGKPRAHSPCRGTTKSESGVRAVITSCKPFKHNFKVKNLCNHPHGLLSICVQSFCWGNQ